MRAISQEQAAIERQVRGKQNKIPTQEQTDEWRRLETEALSLRRQARLRRKDHP
jgi:hypothetical protein